MLCRMFRSIPGFYSLDSRSALPLPNHDIQIVSRHHQMPPDRGVEGTNSFEDHQSSVKILDHGVLWILKRLPNFKAENLFQLHQDA